MDYLKDNIGKDKVKHVNYLPKDGNLIKIISVYCNQPTISSSGKKNFISFDAFSSESEP